MRFLHEPHGSAPLRVVQASLFQVLGEKPMVFVLPVFPRRNHTESSFEPRPRGSCRHLETRLGGRRGRSAWIAVVRLRSHGDRRRGHTWLHAVLFEYKPWPPKVPAVHDSRAPRIPVSVIAPLEDRRYQPREYRRLFAASSRFGGR